MIDFSFYISQTYLFIYFHIWSLHITSTYLLYFFKIIYLKTFLEFFSFIHVISKLSIWSNYAKHCKEPVQYYTLPVFVILKSLYSTSPLAHLKKDDFSSRLRSSRTKKEKFGPPRLLLAPYLTAQTKTNIKIMKTPKSITKLLLDPTRLLLDPLMLDPLRLLKWTLRDSYKKTWTR